MTEEETISERERCRLMWEIALEEIGNTCGEGEKEEFFKSAGELLGLEKSESNDISAKCELVLAQPITKELCYDFRKTRQWVLCNSWALMEKEKIRFGDAIKKSWTDLKAKCAEAGAIM